MSTPREPPSVRSSSKVLGKRAAGSEVALRKPLPRSVYRQEILDVS